MRLNNRLKRLEKSLGTGEECPVCGFHPKEEPKELDVSWPDVDGEEDEAEPEFCSGCGRQLVYVITWMDLDQEGGG